MENRRFEFTAAEMDALHSLKAQDAPPDGGFELGDAAAYRVKYARKRLGSAARQIGSMNTTKLSAKEIEGRQHATDAIGAALAGLDRMSQTLVVE